MLTKEIKEKILKENNLENALEILKEYKDEKWDNDIIQHLQRITPDDDIPIDDFSYVRN